MTMNEPLFFEPEPEHVFTKVAGEVDLPEDPNQWPQEILQELYKQVPYIVDYQPHVEMKRVDAERGYGLGHVEIRNQSEAPMEAPADQLEATGIRTVRIPFVIKDGKLSPFDLLMNDSSKMVPLTENRLRQALFRPQAFDVTSRTPGDQSMIGQLYPPYRQNYGFGGGGVSMNASGGMAMGKLGSTELEQYLMGASKEAGLFGGIAGAGIGGALGTALGPLGTVGGALTGGYLGHKATEDFGGKVGGGAGTVAGGAAGAAAGGYGGYRLGKYLAPLLGMGQGTGALLGGLGGAALGGYTGAGVGRHMGQYAGRGFQDPEGTGAPKVGSVLESVLGSLNPDDHERFLEAVTKEAQYLHSSLPSMGAYVHECLNKVIEAQPVIMKLANWADLIPPTVVQISKRNDGYLMKTASNLCWAPTEVLLSRGDVVRGFGEKLAMDVDTTGSVTMAEGKEPVPGEEPSEELASIQEAGFYKVKDLSGKEHVGFATPELVDTNGETVPVRMFTNGTVIAVQADILGEPAGSGGNLPSGPIGKHGAFHGATPEGKIQITVPFEIENTQQMGEDPGTYVGTCFDGRPIKVSLQPNIQVPTGNDDTLLIPDNWQWLPLDGAQSVTLLGGEHEPETDAQSLEQKVSCVQIRSDGSSFSFSGPPVEKLGSADKDYLDVDQAMFLLAGLGVHQVSGAEKLAEAITGRAVAELQVTQPLFLDADMRKEAEACRGELSQFINQYVKQPFLVKEAVNMPDPTTVDTVLSLGFVNPDNVMNYVSYLPDLDAAQSKLCELLFGVRLGLSNVPQSSIERSIRSLEEAIEGLKILAFQGS